MKIGVHLTPLNPPFIAAYVAVAVWLLHRFAPLYPFSFPGQRFAATALIVAGFLLALQSLKRFLKADTTFDPTELDAATTLVTDGLFRYSRNPIYLGIATCLAGLGLSWGTLWTLPGVLAFCLILTRTQILPEERALEKIFAEEYREYKRRVRRWI